MDNLTAVGGFIVVGVAALVVHESVESLQLWGVSSTVVVRMQLLEACVEGIDALCVLWLCGVAAIKFCITVLRGTL